MSILLLPRSPMSARSAAFPCLECWRWQGLRIRCGLAPDDAQLPLRHWHHGLHLVEGGALAPWALAKGMLRLMLEVAADTALPWHWRANCLDFAYVPLQALQRMANCRPRQRQLMQLRNQLATLRMAPSLTPNELAEGNPYA